MERVVAYIDGFNLYYGLREKGWRRFYWLNVQAMARHLLKPEQTLVDTKYFTSIVKHPDDRRRRQAAFLDALRTLSDVSIHLGHFLSDTVVCRNCGHTYEAYHEKMTDVNISVELLSDAYHNRFDAALLVTADSDLVGPTREVQRLFSGKRVVVAFPPARASKALMQVASGHIHIGRDTLAESQFPDAVATQSGFVLRRPAQWR
jgi:uncharacterized LabA/DUF88 family protein